MSCHLLRRLFSLLLALALPAWLAAASPLEESAALIKEGKFLAAERLIEPLATGKRPEAEALFQLSQVRAAQHQLPEAVKLAERALKLESGHAAYHAQLGSALWQQSQDRGSFIDADRIRKEFERALALDANHVPALLGLARFHLSSIAGKHTSVKKARDYATRAAELDPVLGSIELGDIAARSLDLAGALAHYQRAIAANPKNEAAQFSCGMALMQLKRRDEARVHFQTALKLRPGYEPAKQGLEALDAPAAIGAPK